MFENGAADPRLNAFLEAALDAVVGMDEQGRVVAWNRQAEATFGWTAAEALGARLADLIVPEDKRQAHEGGLRRFLETGASKLLNTRIEVEATGRDGRTFPVELAIVPVAENGGTVFYAYLRNIACRRAMEATLKRRATESRILFEAAMLISREGGFEEMFRTFLRLICETVGWQWGHAYLVDQSAGQILPTSIWHPADAPMKEEMQGYPFRPGEGLPGRVWQSGQPEFVRDVANSPGLPRRDLALRHGVHSTFGFPVFVDGKVHAVLEFFSGEERSPDDEELRLVRTLGLQLGRVVERRRAAEQERLLLRELSHRTNNLMATTAAIFRQSARNATGVDQLAATYSARLDLLAMATNLLSESGWRSVPFAALIRRAFASVGGGERVRLSGGDLDVRAQDVMMLGLLLHELAANAAAHGALSTDAGEVSLEWDVEEGPGQSRALRMSWTERGGPAVASADRKGFGTTLVENILSRHPGSSGELRFEPSGLVAELRIALHSSGRAAPGGGAEAGLDPGEELLLGAPSGGADPGEVPIHLAAALDDLPVLIWMSGHDKGGIHFNRAWLEFTGRSLEQEAGEGWVSGVHPDDMPALEACREAFAARRPFQIEFRLRRADGAWRWMVDKAAPRFGADGSFHGFIGCCIDITERKQAEAGLRSSDETLQLAQKAAGIGTYDWDIPNDRITWSPEMFRLHGIDPETPPAELYAAWLASLHPEDRDRADRETRSFLERADDLTIEFRSLHPDGAIRWIQGRGKVIRDARGEPVRMIGANFDVTERRLAEESLRESEQRLTDIAANFPGVIFRRITHPDGRVEYPYFSGADQQVLHLQRERLAAIRTMEDVVRLVHVDDVDEMLARFERAAATLTPLEVEGRIIAEGGDVRWVRSVSRPQRREDGALIWDGVLLDVTEQRRREGERERAGTMLRMGIDVAGIGTWEFDPAQGTIVGSAVTNALFQLPGDDRPRPSEDYMRAVHPDDVDRVRRGLFKGAAERKSTAREYRVLAQGGGIRWIASRGAYARLSDGSERLIGALQDVTDRKRREEEREAALRQQQILLKELNHRVKNILQITSGVLKLQAARVREPAVRDELAKAVGRVQTIGDLHAQFGMEEGGGRIDVAQYLQEMCERLRNSVLAERPVELRCEAVACVIDVDRAVPLGLVVNELVTNAIKYAFPGDAKGAISIRLAEDVDAGLVLTVADDGVGLPEGGAPARGLGTELVRGLLSQIGATMEVSGGHGLTCAIRFSRRRQAPG